MTAIHHAVTLIGAEPYGSRLPPAPLGHFLSNLDTHLRQAVSVAFRGRSRSPGRPPAWLGLASDVRFLGVEGRHETVLHFEAPTFSDAVPQIFAQGEFWTRRPAPDATAFEAYANVLRDVRQSNRESDYFDPPMLRGFRSFRRSIGTWFHEARIEDRHGASQSFAALDLRTIDCAAEMGSVTPAGRRVRIVGVLDMLRMSTQTFGIKLDSGEEVRGSVPDDSLDAVAMLLNRRVVVDGRAVFRPSRRLLRVDAECISAGEAASSLFSKVPEPMDRRTGGLVLRRPQGPATGVNAFFGRWPGEETDDELLRKLDDLN